jgi:hypothetical protein
MNAHRSLDDLPDELLPFVTYCRAEHCFGGWVGDEECRECNGDGRVLRLPPMYGPVQMTAQDLAALEAEEERERQAEADFVAIFGEAL